MEKTALAQEKVWFDKPSYDKAERLYFERMAKVVSDKIMGSCTLKSEISIISNRQDITNINPLPKTKSEKSKDNKSLISESISNDILKNSKRRVKFLEVNEIEDDCNVPRKKNLKEKQNDGEKNYLREKETSTSDDTSKKYSAKELKGQKNKADTRHSNEHKGKNDTKKVKENMASLLTNNYICHHTPYLPPDQRNQQTASPILSTGGSLANEVAKARQHIKQSLQCIDDIATVAGVAVPNEIKKESIEESKAYQELKAIIEKLEERVRALEEKFSSTTSCAKVVVCPAAPAPAPKQQSEKAEDEDDVDLFGSDSEGEDAEAAKIREERLAAYNAKKSKKPALIAKSNIIFDVKPWDDETDMKEMETMVRQIETDGLLWGAAKLVPLAYGIHKLQISCVVEDDKVSVDWLTEKIQEFEDFVQSVDIAAFNKV